jgi:hypothetical protein
LTPSDSLSRGGAFARAAVESNPASDSLARSGAFGRGMGETVTASDLFARRIVIHRSMAELLMLNDVVNGRWLRYLGQPRHRITEPGRTKSGAVPGRVKTGEAVPH